MSIDVEKTRIVVRFGKRPSKPDEDERLEYPPHPDHDCEALLLHYATEPTESADTPMVRWPHRCVDGEFLFFTSSENLVTAARALHSEGRINLVSLEYEDDYGVHVLSIDSSGRMEHWPFGFCDYVDDWLDRLITVRLS